MGQRRGWVPGPGDINPETLEAFPALRDHIGKASVTEMEVLHALLKPMDPNAAPVRHARFYFRDEAYTKSLRTQAHKDLFMPGRGLFRNSDKAVEAFKNQLSRKYPVISYAARWNPTVPSPELTGELANGRLDNFRVGGTTLEEDVLNWLMQAIAAEYPDHQELPPAADALDRELDRQDSQRFQSVDGYISRPVEEQALARSLEAAGNRPLVLLAEAGCGKTSMLADFITRQDRQVYYRFVGTTPHSFRLDELSESLTTQWVRDGLLPQSILEYPTPELRLMFPTLCTQAAAVRPFLLILDGMDQLQGNENWHHWLPSEMPAGSALMISLRSDSGKVPDTMAIHRLGPMTNRTDKAMMASVYLNGFFKDIDAAQMDQLLNMEGSSNPLFMKIVLNELRQHGSFDTLMELFRKDFGSTPLSAFQQVLLRVEKELEDSFFSPYSAMFLFFMGLANARQGLDGEIFLRASRNIQGWRQNDISDLQVLDLVYGLARELEPYLVLDGKRISIRYDSLRRAILQAYPEQNRQSANVMLAQAFLQRLDTSHDPEDARTVLDHVCSATEAYAHSFFEMPSRVLSVLRWSSADLVARCCTFLARQRNMMEFAELGKVLQKAAVRLDANPDTLFMELERYGDPRNPVISALLAQASQANATTLLRPLNRTNAYDTLLWEFAHPKPASGCSVWSQPYYVTISDGILRVMDMTVRETVNILHLPKTAERHRTQLTCEGNDLFLCQFSDHYRQVQILHYRLPDLMLLERGPVMDCDHGTLWALHCWNGSVYALQYEQTGSTSGGRYTVSCLSNGNLLFRQTYDTNLQYTLCGGWYVFRDNASGDCRVLSLETGACLFCDRFLGTNHLDPNIQLTAYAKLFANTANLYVACGDMLYIWLGGSRISEDGQIVLVQRMYRLLPGPDGLIVDKTWDGELAHHGSFAVLKSGYLITESHGFIHVMDSDCRFLGKMALGEKLQHPIHAQTHFAEHNGQLLFFLKDKVRGYDLNAYLDALKTDLDDGFTSRRDAVIDKSCLYVMDLEMERTNLNTLETLQEKNSGKQYLETYAPWNMKGADIWIGWGQKTGYFTIKRPGPMDRVIRDQIPNPQQQELLHGFLFRDKQNTMMVGLLVAGGAPIRHPYKNETQEFFKVRLLTKPLLQINSGWNETDLNFEITRQEFTFGMPPIAVVSDGTPYIFLFNGFKEQWTGMMQIYDVLSKQVIFTKELDLKTDCQLSQQSFLPYPNGILYNHGHWENATLEIIDLTIPKLFVIRRPVSILTKDHHAQMIVLYDRDTRELLIYDTLSHRLELVTTLEQDYIPTHAAVLRGCVILSAYRSDTVRIYDRSSGKLLCRQRLEVELSEPICDEDTGTLVMLDSGCRKFFWKLDNPS